MASGFTMINEKLSRGGLNALVGGIKAGAPALNAYPKSGKNIVQAASGSKVKKT